MSKPKPGTFRLYPYASVPIPAGSYTLSGAVSGTPGAIEPLAVAFDVVAPRYTMPPDQILSTFPPATSQGAFATRLPQIVLRRRTIPWERSAPVAEGVTPVPWLALVLIADGEGNVRTDVPVGEAVTGGVALPDPGDRDTPTTVCLEVPASVVQRVFPAQEDLPLLAHVREVDLADTELALGDDDGWMAVVIANRLPLAGMKYTACLINLEGQVRELPVNPPVAEEFTLRHGFDLEAVAALLATGGSGGGSLDAPGMGLTAGVDAAPGSGTAKAAITGSVGATRAGATWAAATKAVATGVSPADAKGVAADVRFDRIGRGLSVDIPFHLFDRVLRFPVLANWTFTCTDGADFQFLANEVSSRLLGHVATGPELPDGGEAPFVRPDIEPPSNRPLPLVAPTGHLVTAHETRIGGTGTAWFRGALIPEPAERPGPRDDGRYPLAHHADQLRRVVPDGREDLSYSAAFEIGRLLALSRPSVVAALNRWRRDGFAAAASAVTADGITARLPDWLGEVIGEFADLPSGRRFARGVLSVLARHPEAVGPPLPDPVGGFAVSDATVFSRARSSRILTGLGIDQLAAGLDVTRVDAADAIWGLVPVLGARDPGTELAVARADLERLAGQLADAAERLEGRRG